MGRIELDFSNLPPSRDAIVDSCAEAAHEAWLEEKVRRLREIVSPSDDKITILSWPSETGEEQLVPWEHLSEPVRDFDRIVVGAIVDVLEERGYLILEKEYEWDG